MQPRSTHTVVDTRDAVASLLQYPTQALTWPVRTALASAFNYLDDALPALTAPPLPSQHDVAVYIDLEDMAARIDALRAGLLRLLESPADATRDLDPYAVGHAAGELGAAVRELTHGRPA